MAALTSEAIFQIADLQQITPADLNAGEQLARGTLDNVVRSFLAESLVYSGFTAALDPVSNGTRVILGTGLLYDGASSGAGYALRDPFTVDLGAKIAAIPADKTALVAILAQGAEAPDVTETRTVLDASKEPTNPEAFWPTTTLAVKTRIVRSVIISSPVGTADVQPQMPPYGTSLCLLATVLINNVGIISITQNAGAQIESLKDVADDAAALTAWRAMLDPRVASLLASVSGLALSIAGLQNLYAEIAKLQAQLNAVQQQANNQGSQQQTGSAPNLSGFDLFLDLTKTDTTMTGNGAIVKDGLRFPTAAEMDAVLAPQNPFAAELTLVSGRYLSPKRARTLAAQNIGFKSFGGAQLGTVTLSATYRGFGVSRTRWDPTLQASSVAQLLLSGDPKQLFASDPEDLDYQAAWGDWRSPTTELTRQAGYAKDLTGRESWSRITGTESFAGLAVIAQPYTSPSNEMIELVAVTDSQGSNPIADGATATMLVMGDLSGSPDPSRCYGKAVWTAQRDTGTGQTNGPLFEFATPIPKKAGETLWFVVLIPGTSYNKFVLFGGPNTPNLGTAKTFLNGYWTPYTFVEALSLTVFRSSFSGSGVLRVPMAPLQLAGGIDAIDLVTPALVPPGCSIDYEVQIGGVGVPVSMITSGSHPLLARPGNLPLTMLLTYTESAAPIIDLTGGVAANFMAGARSEVSRASLTLHHVSDVRVPPANVTKIVETVQLDAFRTDTHTFTAKLLTGPTYTTQTAPNDTKDVVQADGSVKRTFTWALGAAVLGHKVALDGVTSDATKPFSGRRADWTAAP